MNPRYVLTAADRDTVSLFFRGRDPQGGLRHLPQSGGTLDQAALTMDAFAVCEVAVQKIRKEKGS